MKTLLAVIAMLLIGIGTATAEITPMIIKVTSTSSEFVDTYTVPTGKVLLIENYTVHAIEGKLVRLYKDSDIVPLVPLAWNPSPTSLKIPEGWTIKMDKVTAGTTYCAYLFCLLVDPADLYAYVPNEIKSIDIAGARASLVVDLAAARPSQLTVERSSNLEDWHADPDITVTPDPQCKHRHHIELNKTNTVQFFRSIAQARK